jgi:hypothetical protein
MEYIGFEGTGCEVEFNLIKETQKAVLVETTGDHVQVWIPKSVIEDDGSLTQYGCKVFKENYSKAIGE